MLVTDFEHQKVKLLAATLPIDQDYEGDKNSISDYIVYCARVSNPKSQASSLNNEKLLKYLVRNQHWSPFEMAHLTMEIETTRDISRQILRHPSFRFQEFSQRYAQIEDDFILREARAQDLTNRQNSLPMSKSDVSDWWYYIQQDVNEYIRGIYNNAISNGIAKEQARVILPEGMTMTKLYMSGSVRSWKHYIDLRSCNGTQLEHMDIALKCKEQIITNYPELKWIF